MEKNAPTKQQQQKAAKEANGGNRKRVCLFGRFCPFHELTLRQNGPIFSGCLRFSSVFLCVQFFINFFVANTCHCCCGLSLSLSLKVRTTKRKLTFNFNSVVLLLLLLLRPSQSIFHWFRCIFCFDAEAVHVFS